MYQGREKEEERERRERGGERGGEEEGEAIRRAHSGLLHLAGCLSLLVSSPSQSRSVSRMAGSLRLNLLLQLLHLLLQYRHSLAQTDKEIRGRRECSRSPVELLAGNYVLTKTHTCIIIHIIDILIVYSGNEVKYSGVFGILGLTQAHNRGTIMTYLYKWPVVTILLYIHV